MHSSNFRKSTQALTSLSADLAKRTGELNSLLVKANAIEVELSQANYQISEVRKESFRVELELRAQISEVIRLQNSLESAVHELSLSNAKISDLEKFVLNLSNQLSIELVYNQKMFQELDSIRKLRGYRILSKLWKSRIR